MIRDPQEPTIYDGPMSSRAVTTWVPNQHGAWAMVIVPCLTGSILGGFSLRGGLLLIAWLAAYCAYYALGQWLRAPKERRTRWWPPLLTYGTIAALAGGTLLVIRPALVWWGPVFALCLGVSLVFTANGAQRAWLNDLVLMVAANLMTVVAYGAALPASVARAKTWLPPGVDDRTPWLAGLMLFAYFFGTVFYVKTMLRDRHRPATYAASVAYHVLLAGAAWLLGSLPGLVGLLLLARAVIVPKLPGPVPTKYVGFGEFGATMLVLAAVLVAA